MRQKIGLSETVLAASTTQLEKVGKDIAARTEKLTEEFGITVAGRSFAGKEAREPAAKALNEVIAAWKDSPSLKGCGSIAGFDILCRGEVDGSLSTYLRGEAIYAINVNFDNPVGTLMSIERTLRGLETVKERLDTEIDRETKALAEYRMQSEKPFDHEERLKELLVEQARLNAALDLDKDDSQAVVADNDNEEGSSPVIDVDSIIRADVPLRDGGEEALSGRRLAVPEF